MTRLDGLHGGLLVPLYAVQVVQRCGFCRPLRHLQRASNPGIGSSPVWTGVIHFCVPAYQTTGDDSVFCRRWWVMASNVVEETDWEVWNAG